MRIKARGFLARAFQHECDHLSGILYTSKVKDITTLHKLERTPEREEEIKRELEALRAEANQGAAQDTGA